MEWRKIELRMLEFLRSNKIAVAGDGLGDQHFVITRGCGSRGSSGLLTKCPFVVQTGESCGFEHERISIEKLARFLAEVE